MRILLTNDDGIHAPGLALLQRIAQSLSDDVWTVAPEFDQSGVAHSMSLSDPLRLRQVAAQSYAVKGTPTDCVIMGVRYLLADKPPDLVLSGVNLGQNVAEDVTYSGTIAGAMEGTVLGIPSIALSQGYGLVNTRTSISWDCAEAHAVPVIDKVLEQGIPKNILININFPDCRPEEVQGVAVTMQGKRQCKLLEIEERADGRGVPYYWLVFSRNKVVAEQGTDLQALIDRKVSVTPLRMDLTDEPTVTQLASAFSADGAPRRAGGRG